MMVSCCSFFIYQIRLSRITNIRAIFIQTNHFLSFSNIEIQRQTGALHLPSQEGFGSCTKGKSCGSLWESRGKRKKGAHLTSRDRKDPVWPCFQRAIILKPDLLQGSKAVLRKGPVADWEPSFSGVALNLAKLRIPGNHRRVAFLSSFSPIFTALDSEKSSSRV